MAAAPDVRPEVRYAPVPDWVKPASIAPRSTQDIDAPAVIDIDVQVKSTKETNHLFRAVSSSILRREGLEVGNLNIPWQPSAGALTVHYVRLLRDGETIDVLSDHAFSLINMEKDIEASILSGLMVANLQIPGLRVGDRIELAYTTQERPLGLPGDRSFSMQAPLIEYPGTFRAEARWEPDGAINWRATDDIRDAIKAGPHSVRVTMKGLGAVQFPEGAPDRYAMARRIQFSNHDDWSEVSKAFFPLFERSSRIDDNSDVARKADAIAADHKTVEGRAVAALKLVQDEVRYVYVGLNGGNYIPASAEETWQRRYGDCKGKTALLLALLDRLGIEAEAVLVDSSGSDVIDEMLPTPAAFDHVLVRARIDGRDVWMDGTVAGDAKLRDEPISNYRHALALSPAGSKLEDRPQQIAQKPSHFDITQIDATGGFDEKAAVSIDYFDRGPGAHLLRILLSGMSSSGAQSALEQYFGSSEQWVDGDTYAWEWLADADVLHMSMKGKADLDWETDDDGTHEMTLAGAGFYLPAKRQRLAGQPQDAPWTNDPDSFKCYAVVTHLPKPGKGLSWDHDTAAIMTEVGGVAYWRVGDLSDRTVRTVQSSRTVKAEITAEEARRANDKIADFDDAMSNVYETDTPDESDYFRSVKPGFDALPSFSAANWREAEALCRPPRG